MRRDIVIRRARASDATMISNVGRSVKLAGKLKKKQSKRGFLRGDVRTKSYLRAIKNSSYFLVAVDGKRVVGFLKGYQISLIEPESYLEQYVMRNYAKTKSVFIDQVAVLPSFQGRSIGRRMYEVLLRKAGGMKVFAVSWAVPYNRASEQFHLKLGFRKVKKLKGVSKGMKAEGFIWVNNNGFKRMRKS